MTSSTTTTAEYIQHDSITQTSGNSRILIGEKVYIRKRGKGGRYAAEFWHNNQNCKQSLKTTNFQIARQRALKLDNELLAGSYAAPVAPILISDAITEFLDVKKGEDRAPKTITKYREWLESFDEFAGQNHVTKLQQITPQLFEKYRAFRKATQSPKSMRTGLMIVKSLTKWCSPPSREYLQKNPLAGCKVPEPYEKPKFCPSRRQVSRILEAASNPARAQYALLAYSGLRSGEMQALRPRDVDLQRGWIRIKCSDEWVSKTRKVRKVPIHPGLREILDAYLSTLPASAVSRPYFFCAHPSPKYPKGNHQIDLRKLNDRFQRLAKSLGFKTGRKNNGLVIHSLRHFFETCSVNSGVNQLVIDHWMGHAGDGSMAKTYYGRSNAVSRRFMKRVRFMKKPKLQGQPASTEGSVQNSN